MESNGREHPVVVAIDDAEPSADAIALASRLARASAARLVLATMSRGAPDAPAGEARDRRVEREPAERLIADVRATAARDLDVDIVQVVGCSPAPALRNLAERLQAAVVVVGPPRGRVLPGTAHGLATTASCPVAVVPHELGMLADDPISTIGVGYAGSAAAHDAVAAATRLAQDTGAALRVIGICESEHKGILPGLDFVMCPTDHERAVRERLRAVLAALPAGVRGCDVVVHGDPARHLLEQSSALDVLFLGSRARGPMGGHVLARVVGKVMRDAACPVVVVPASQRLSSTSSAPTGTAASSRHPAGRVEAHATPQP